MSRVRDIANIMSANTSMATDAEVTSATAYIPANVAGKNAIINGGFDFWQRGVSFASTGGAYSADRWYVAASGSGSTTFSRQSSGSTLPQFQYCMRSQRTSGNSELTSSQIAYAIETSEALKFAGKTITVSFYARAGANYSAAANVLYFLLNYGTGTDQRLIGAGFTGSANIIFQGPVLTTAWQRFSFSVDMPTTSTEIGFYAQSNPSGTAGAADYYEVTGFQLELGSIATPFSRAGGTIQGELAACQRYYSRWTAANGGSAYAFIHPVWAYSTTQAFGLYTYPVPMRTTPSLETTGTASNYRVVVGNSFITCSGVPSLDQANPYTINIQYPVASGLTVGQAGVCGPNSNNTAYLGFSAEL